ncbi:MAG: phospholipid/cholesterol/gamma-HCH transport system permease protein, partial [Kiritimatiellia bacterium]
MTITREPKFYEPATTTVQRVGRQVLILWESVGRAAIMAGLAFLDFRYIFSRRNRHEVFYQMFVTGIRSLGVLTVVALFTGMIFALQTGIELARYGQEVNVGGAVTVVMLREMGPFMAGMILTASVGSSIGAQLGTMTVSEEIAALEIMSIDPIRFLVMPRLVA